jgi:hypothetical protein
MFGNKSPKENFIEPFGKTLFLTTLVSLIFFLILDLVWPGFVSKTFSVHWFLLAAIISGIFWGSVIKNKK